MSRTLCLLLAALILSAGCEVNQGDEDVEDTGASETSTTPADTEPVPPPEDTTAPDASSDDTASTDTNDPTDTVPAPQPIEGCGWLDGSWTLYDCQNVQFSVNFFVQADCSVLVLSNSPILAGAVGQVNDAALTLFLRSVIGSCHGFYDGSSLVGACDALGGACSFVATPDS